MVSAKQVINSTKSKPIPMPSATPLGSPGYDNVRDDIEKTKHIREGTIQKVPVDDDDIVNKKYHDDNTPANVFLFFTENASDIATYLDMVPSPTGDAEENTLTAIPGSSSETLMASYASTDGCSCISGLVELPIGLYKIHIHAKASTAGALRLFAKVYKRAADTTETLLFTTEDSNLISTSEEIENINGSLNTEVDWLATDRLVVKLYGKNESAAARDLTIYVEGTTASRFELPAISATPGPASPTGAITMYGGSTAPSGWLLCFGAAVSRTTYAALFAIIGTAYGVGDGSTTFNVPSFSQKIPRGATLGVTGGSDTQSITEANMPSHTHSNGTLKVNGTHTHSNGTYKVNGTHFHVIAGATSAVAGSSRTFHNNGAGNATSRNTNAGGDNVDIDGTSSAGGDNVDIDGITTATGGGTAHNNIPAFLGVNFIIKT